MKYIYCFILIVFISCTNNKQVENKELNNIKSVDNIKIDSIRVLYYNYIFNRITAINCDRLKDYIPDFKSGDSDGILPFLITSQLVLEEINSEINRLSPSQGRSEPDIRINFKIFYSNKEQKQICIGNIYSSEIFIDGVLQEQNNRLLYLIKNNAGYYSWFGKHEFDFMPELQDTTFIHEPMIISPYYEEYLKYTK